MSAARIALRGYPWSRQNRVTGPANADEPVAQEQPCLQLRRRSPEYTDFQVDYSFTQRLRILVGLRNEPDTHVRCGAGDLRHQRGAHQINKSVIGPNRECPLQSGHIHGSVARLKHSLGITGKFMNTLSELLGVGSGNQRPSCQHKQRIARGDSQPGKRPAHGGRAQAKPARRLRHAALGEQHIQ
ncbi:hypothetical protein CDEF62S_00992 [Castellaniella defragrans]